MAFDEKQAAIAASEKAFSDAMEAACNELDTLLSGRDASEPVELDRVCTSIRLARRTRAEMLKLIDAEWPS